MNKRGIIVWSLLILGVLLMSCSNKKKVTISILIPEVESEQLLIVYRAPNIASISDVSGDTLYPNSKGRYSCTTPHPSVQVFLFELNSGETRCISSPLFISSPGKYKIKLKNNPEQKELSVTNFEGHNQKGVMQFLDFVQFTRTNSTETKLNYQGPADSFMEHLGDEITRELAPFVNFYDNVEIDDYFFNFATQYISYWYAYQGLELINQNLKVTQKEELTEERELWLHHKEVLTRSFPTKSAELQWSNHFEDYINEALYQLIDQNRAEYDSALRQSSGQTWALSHIKSLIHPDLYPIYALQYLSDKAMRLDIETITLFKELQKAYPKYESYLSYKLLAEEKIPQIEKFNSKKADLASNQAIILDDEVAITHFYQIRNRFYGEYLLVDVWASWCPDCIAEFEHKEKVDSWLNAQQINSLYIALERSPDRERWKKYISHYGLKGYHVLADNTLKQDLYNLLGTGSLWIPRYFLINPLGEIVAADLPTPSHWEKFKKAIQSAMVVPIQENKKRGCDTLSF